MIPDNEEQIRKKYLGVQYLHMGRDARVGLDCYGLLKCVFADLGRPLFEVEEYAKDWAQRGGNYFLDNYYNQFEESDCPMPFDVALFKNSKGVPNHAGLVLSDGKFLHTCRAGTVVSRLNDRQWKERLVGFYRIKSHDSSIVSPEQVLARG